MCNLHTIFCEILHTIFSRPVFIFFSFFSNFFIGKTLFALDAAVLAYYSEHTTRLWNTNTSLNYVFNRVQKKKITVVLQNAGEKKGVREHFGSLNSPEISNTLISQIRILKYFILKREADSFRPSGQPRTCWQHSPLSPPQTYLLRLASYQSTLWCSSSPETASLPLQKQLELQLF